MTIERDIDVMARTLWGEARNQGLKGMEAVASVVMNRLEVSKEYKYYWWGNTVEKICLKNKQFSCWNENDPNLKKMYALTPENKIFARALEIAELAVHGDLKDNTKGSTHYHTKSIKPYWIKGEKPRKTIRDHVFYRPGRIPDIEKEKKKKWVPEKKSFLAWLFAWF